MQNNKKEQPVSVQGTQLKGTAAKPANQQAAHKAPEKQPEKHPTPAQKPTATKPQQQQQQHPKPTTQQKPTQQQQQKPHQQHVQQQKQQTQDQQQHKQEIKQQQPPAPQKLEPKRKIGLKQMLEVMDQDKENKKISFLVDKTGNAYTFFKYKGTIIDISQYMIFEHTQGKKREDSIEQARKCVVYGLQAGDNLVFSTDLASTNLSKFFESQWYKPECIFNYDEIVNPKYFRTHLLKPEEDKDGFGNQGQFYPKEDLHIVLLFTLKEGELDYDDHLKNLGLDHLKERFVVTIIEE